MTTPQTLGRYRIIAELGQGGMAEVFLTMIGGPTGSGFTKLAVVKRLRPNLVEDPEFVAMLVDEARISARLNHPNVVQTMEVGVDGEEYFIAMEFLDGQPLHRIQRRGTRTSASLPRSAALLVVADTLAGLHHAHELEDYDGSPLGIVNRDVTPQNIFVTYDGTVKVVDFGIAKAAGRSSETKQGIVKGKVRYMSPEQAVGGVIDRRSDVFAAGLLLWEAVTGLRFWRGHDDLMIVQLLLSGNYDASPRAVDPSVPEAVDAMCRKALALRPEDRFASADELRSELESFLEPDLVDARRQLGPLVAEMFSAERARVREIIERAGRASTEPLSVAALMSAHSTSASVNSSSTHAMATSIFPPRYMDSAPVSLMPAPAPPPAGRWPRTSVYVMAACLLMTVASAVLAVRKAGWADFSVATAEASRRAPAQAQSSRMDVFLESATQSAPHAGPHPTDQVSAPASLARRLNSAELPFPPVQQPIASSAPATPPPAPADRAEFPPKKRLKPKIDLADPWSGQHEPARPAEPE